MKLWKTWRIKLLAQCTYCIAASFAPAFSQTIDSQRINYPGGVIQDICGIETQDGTLASSVDKSVLSSGPNEVKNVTIGAFTHIGNPQHGTIKVTSNMKSGAVIALGQPQLNGPSAADQYLISVGGSSYDTSYTMNTNRSGNVKTSSVNVLFKNSNGFSNGDYQAFVSVTCSAK